MGFAGSLMVCRMEWGVKNRFVSWGTSEDKFNPNVLTNRRRLPPNPETPGPHVALDTPKDPEVALGACILYSLGLKVMIIQPALGKLGVWLSCQSACLLCTRLNPQHQVKTWLHPGNPRTQEVEVEDEKFKVIFRYIVNYRLETLPHKVGSEGEEGGGGRRREAEEDLGGADLREGASQTGTIPGTFHLFVPAASMIHPHRLLPALHPALLSQQLPSPLHNTC